MIRLFNPLAVFFDASGALMDGGKIYVGMANADPQASPTTVYWDKALTIPAAQPLRTSGGLIVNNGQPATAYINSDDFSIRLANGDDVQVFYSPSTVSGAGDFQPLDSDLTAIAALGTTAFGRSLLTLLNQAALAAATGIPAPLPAAGGTVTGNIVRQGAGAVFYGASPALTGCRIFGPLPVGSTNPATQPGDIVGFY